MSSDADRVIEFNVGGVHYSTMSSTLTRYPDSRLPELLPTSTGSDVSASRQLVLCTDADGRPFVDRDGELFRFILDFARTGTVTLPEGFADRRRLLNEADYFRLSEMTSLLAAAGPAGGAEGAVGGERRPGYVVVGYRGTFGFGGGRGDTQSDTRFRKVSRILVCGRVSLCREVFGETLNESRDPDRGSVDRYSARFYLKHAFLEQAFDALQARGFRMAAACGTGMSAGDRKSADRGRRNAIENRSTFNKNVLGVSFSVVHV